MLSLFIRKWQMFLFMGAALTALATVTVLKMQIADLVTAVELAETNETLARTTATRERKNATELAERLANSQSELILAVAARDAAEKARHNLESRSAERDQALGEVIATERENDESLDLCLARELPDSILRQLPE